MTHITCSFPSYALGTIADFHVILPKQVSLFDRQSLADSCQVPPEGYPVIFLLHGAGDCGDDWLLHSRVADLADQYQMALIMPSIGNSFYLDGVGGVNAYSYITEELLTYARSIFPLSKSREHIYLCGYSMGGYGAVRMGLLRPDLYRKVISLSGALDIKFAACYFKSCGYALPGDIPDLNSLRSTDVDINYCLNSLSTSPDE